MNRLALEFAMLVWRTRRAGIPLHVPFAAMPDGFGRALEVRAARVLS